MSDSGVVETPGAARKTANHDNSKYGVYHHTKGHSIFSCEFFKGLSHKNKMANLSKLGRCTRCTGSHEVEDCTRQLKCSHCPNRHVSLLHPWSDQVYKDRSEPSRELECPLAGEERSPQSLETR